MRGLSLMPVLSSAQRSFAQPAACLRAPAKLTPEPTKHEGRNPRASERHAVGCCEELAGPEFQRKFFGTFDRPYRQINIELGPIQMIGGGPLHIRDFAHRRVTKPRKL